MRPCLRLTLPLFAYLDGRRPRNETTSTPTLLNCGVCVQMVFVAMILSHSLPAVAQINLFDPQAFPSIGRLDLASGAYSIDTTGPAPKILDPGGNTLFTGSLIAQGVPAGVPFHGFDPNVAVFTFDSISIANGVTVSATGENPFALLSKTFADIDGDLLAAGKNGESSIDGGAGGAGGPGAGRGGSGVVGSAIQGESGSGPGGGVGGFNGLSSRAEGAGFGGAGAPGNSNLPGQPYGDLRSFLQAGSGGGGSGHDFFAPNNGAGGGGGGGGIEIGALGLLTINGDIDVGGGGGRGSGTPGTELAGGGSGGGLRIHAPFLRGAGTLIAKGGSPAGGNGGGGGRILVLTEVGSLPMSATVAAGSPFAGIGVLESDVLNLPSAEFVAELVAGSPATVSQTFSGTLSGPVDLDFDYLFGSTGGLIEVKLDGTSLGTVVAPSSPNSQFMTTTLQVDGGMFSGTNHTLEFTFDGLTGSTALLDNISFPGINNGNFEFAKLGPWLTSGSGRVQVVMSAVPEPSSATLVGLIAVAVFVTAYRRRAARCSSSGWLS